MKDFDPKQKSQGLGDTVAKFTHLTGINKAVETVIKIAGKEDCGCNKRRKILNEVFPYTKENPQPTSSTISLPPLNEKKGRYLVLQEIHTNIPNIGEFIFIKGTELLVDSNHPLYNDIEFYYKKQIVKKL
jgi:hypothetical protein